MADLEETIFKQNVPGKYSTWARGELPDRGGGIRETVEEGDEIKLSAGTEQGMDDEELLGYASQLSQADIPESVRNSILAERAGRPATGVKGVLADYKAAQRMKLAQRQADAAHRAAVLDRMARGYIVPQSAENCCNEINSHHRENGKNLVDENDDSDIELEKLLLGDDDSDEFMREFRTKRLKELKDAAATICPSFGSVREIGAADFLSEVEGEQQSVFVIVHLYESSVQMSVRMNNILEELSVRMPLVKFLRMHASINCIEVDRLTLPILSLYRGGTLLESFVGISEILGTEYFTRDDVEWLLDSSISDMQ